MLLSPLATEEDSLAEIQVAASNQIYEQRIRTPLIFLVYIEKAAKTVRWTR